MSTYIDPPVQQMRAGDLKPDLVVVISDEDEAADFLNLTEDQVTVLMERDGQVIDLGPVTSIDEWGEEGMSATVRRLWGDGETVGAGHAWVSIVVEWSDGVRQTFPSGEPLRLDLTP